MDIRKWIEVIRMLCSEKSNLWAAMFWAFFIRLFIFALCIFSSYNIRAQIGFISMIIAGYSVFVRYIVRHRNNLQDVIMIMTGVGVISVSLTANSFSILS